MIVIAIIVRICVNIIGITKCIMNIVVMAMLIKLMSLLIVVHIFKWKVRLRICTFMRLYLKRIYKMGFRLKLMLSFLQWIISTPSCLFLESELHIILVAHININWISTWNILTMAATYLILSFNLLRGIA